MKISIITLFPDMVSGFFKESIIKRAIEKKLVDIEVINLRDFAKDKYKTVDDRPYGGGTGMVLKVDVLKRAIDSISAKSESKKQKIIITSPRGRLFSQKKAIEYSKLEDLIIIAGHYESYDERVINYIDEEISVGDFILTGGEIVAAAIVDSVVRLIPNVLKKSEATQEESFSKDFPLEYPQYTKPYEFEGKKVPEILLSGDHKKIKEWRIKKSNEITKKFRPDLLEWFFIFYISVYRLS